MGEAVYEVSITHSAKNRFQQYILPYVYSNFSFDRAGEINDNILEAVLTLNSNPFRGRIEEYLKGLNEEFRFILYKETNQFELKIIYFIDEEQQAVFITDFFPTKMNPDKVQQS